MGRTRVSAADEVAHAIAAGLDVLAPLAEAVNGYRLRLIAFGWPAEQAAEVAAELLIDLNR